MSRVPHRLRTLAALARAAAGKRAARLAFADAGGRTADHVVTVLGLAFDGGRWTVVAWDHTSQALRVLDAGRVQRVVTLRTPACAPPPGFDARGHAWPEWLDAPPGGGCGAALWVHGQALAIVESAVPLRRRAPARHGGWTCLVRTGRTDRVAALARSLSPWAEVHSASMPPRPAARQQTAEARLLGLASWLLAQGEPVTRRQIVEAFPDSYRGTEQAIEKKLTRDKDALRRLGYAVSTVELGGRADAVGYVLSARACKLPKLALAPEEAVLLWSAGVGAAALSPHPLREELESALRKLVVGAQGLPPRAAALEELAATPAAPRQHGLLERLVDAWERRKRITVTYWRAASDALVERQVDVYGWGSRRGEWIFVGHCHLRKGVRIFYLSRVRKLRVNTVRSQDPDYEVPADFDLRRWSRQQIWDYDVHPPRPATVRFRGSLARIARNLLPGTASTLDVEGGRVARLQVRNLRGLVRQVLAWGPEAELLEPEDGRALAREILQRLAPPTEAP